MEAWDGTWLRPRQVRYQAALRRKADVVRDLSRDATPNQHAPKSARAGAGIRVVSPLAS
jgi:hypothetical protein